MHPPYNTPAGRTSPLGHVDGERPPCRLSAEVASDQPGARDLVCSVHITATSGSYWVVGRGWRFPSNPPHPSSQPILQSKANIYLFTASNTLHTIKDMNIFHAFLRGGSEEHRGLFPVKRVDGGRRGRRQDGGRLQVGCIPCTTKVFTNYLGIFSILSSTKMQYAICPDKW